MSAVWRMVRLTSHVLPAGQGPGGGSPLEHAGWEPSTPKPSTTKSAPPTRDATLSKKGFIHPPDVEPVREADGRKRRVERTEGPTGAPKGTGQRSPAAPDSTTESGLSFCSLTSRKGAYV